MSSIEFGLIAVAWVVVSIAFGLCVCPLLFQNAPGGDE